MNQDRIPILSAMQEFLAKDPAFFRIPGHRAARGIDPALVAAFGRDVFSFDLTEAEGLDDLHQPVGAILEAEKLYADLFGAKKSFLLVNGTTCGNEAMVLASAKEGESVLVPRNAHKSVLMGLILSGARPVYVMPSYLKEWKIAGSLTPEAVRAAIKGCREMPKSLLLVHPTYYGIGSDVRAIADICHESGIWLLADEAHGSHLYASDVPPLGAAASGADLVAMSIHKTSGSFTQSSVLHICSDRVSEPAVREALGMLQSTSPSYLLMASLDAARHTLWKHGAENLKRARGLAEELKRALRTTNGIRVLDVPHPGVRPEAYSQDTTRVVFTADALGIGGYRLQELLYERSGISLELSDAHNVVAVITGANTERDIERLARAVADVAADKEAKGEEKGRSPEAPWIPVPPEVVMTPREAYFHGKRTVPLSESAGEIAGEMVVPYPPGIPLICPGERITAELIGRIRDLRACGVAFHGPSDDTLAGIRIIDA